MKKILLVVAILSLIYITESCTKKSTKTAFTNATMKPWFDSHCSSCHASGASNAASWTYDATDASTVQNNITTINNNVYVTRSMPQGAALSQAELDKFKSWYDSGHPSN